MEESKGQFRSLNPEYHDSKLSEHFHSFFHCGNRDSSSCAFVWERFKSRIKSSSFRDIKWGCLLLDTTFVIAFLFKHWHFKDLTITDPKRQQKAHSSLQASLSQIIAVTVKNLLLIEFGLSQGFPTILIPSLSGKDSHEKIQLENETISWIGSTNLLFSSLGCITAGSITRVIGRKRGMQLATLPFIAGWLLLYFSEAGWEVLMALSLLGFGGGLLEAPVITYVAEITQPKLRGALASTSSTSVVLGILLQFFIGTLLPWRKAAFANLFFPLFCFMILFLIPESPVWLLTKNRQEEAKKSLIWLRGWTTLENVQQEFLELSSKISGEDNKPKSFLRSFKYLGKKEVYYPMFLVTFAFFLEYFNGSTTNTVYAIAIFRTLNTPIDEYYATIIMGSVEFLGCVCCIFIIHSTGKRLLIFMSLIGSGVCCLVVASYTCAKGIFYLGQKEQIEEQWTPVVFLIMSSFFAFAGARALPWVLIGEIFPTKYRPNASGLAAGIGYALGFIPNKIFLAQVDLITLPGVFLFDTLVCLLGLVLLYFFLPETEGKTLFEITDHFLGISKLGNDVRRKTKPAGEKRTVNGFVNESFKMDYEEIIIVKEEE